MAKVEIYTRMMCGFCARALRLLKDKGVDFEEYDASFSPDLRKEMIQRADGRSTFPQIFIDDKGIGGCDELYALDRAGKLDPMLENAS